MYPLASCIGHRGLAAHAPENTLAGIRRAHAAGLRWVEVDIRRSRDNIAVLSHDASLRRCGGRYARIKNKTAAQLAVLPVAAAAFGGEGVPSLAAALALLKTLRMGVVAEIKPDDNYETETVRAVAAALAQFVSPLIISSFSVPMLLAAKKQLPAVARAVNCKRPDAGVFAALRKTAAANLHCGKHSSRVLIKRAAESGYGVYCYTVDDAAQVRQLLAAGAHGVFTNIGLGAGAGMDGGYTAARKFFNASATPSP